jgi:hypothetical protein
MSISEAYNELISCDKFTSDDVSTNSEDECYELTTFPQLQKIVQAKYAKAIYVSVEVLIDPDSDDTVFNLMFFDDSEESIGGCELTQNELFWDEEA